MFMHQQVSDNYTDDQESNDRERRNKIFRRNQKNYS